MQPVSFKCPVCGLTFDDEQWARACEAWCRTHESCNLAITAHARERNTATAADHDKPTSPPEREHQ